MPPIVRRLFGYIALSVVAAAIFHEHLDIVGPVVGLVLVGLIGIYGLAPTMIDTRTGRVRHDKAPIPEWIRERRRRRHPNDEDEQAK